MKNVIYSRFFLNKFLNIFILIFTSSPFSSSFALPIFPATFRQHLCWWWDAVVRVCVCSMVVAILPVQNYAFTRSPCLSCSIVFVSPNIRGNSCSLICFIFSLNVCVMCLLVCFLFLYVYCLCFRRNSHHHNPWFASIWINVVVRVAHFRKIVHEGMCVVMWMYHYFIFNEFWHMFSTSSSFLLLRHSFASVFYLLISKRIELCVCMPIYIYMYCCNCVHIFVLFLLCLLCCL